MITKRSKVSRARGNKTHGWGHKKKHRGFGNKGGKGNAGSGKRADSKKPSYWRNETGRLGFKSKNTIALKVITLKELDKKFKEGDLNLTELGYDKLLGTGNINKKFNITVSSFTPKALDKVEAAGGKIIGSDDVSEPADETEETSE
ncbi:uL15 family ribosomal protein [Candidatus Woesearchaeota archaeon]|nr:uL15 family ribosomal protein [Candidatus Woesearchaeota archaeon]